MVWAETIATYKEMIEAESWESRRVINLSGLSNINAIVNRVRNLNFYVSVLISLSSNFLVYSCHHVPMWIWLADVMGPSNSRRQRRPVL
jgi:hypothetical protein